jgi:tetratricopeptide (TPR) repeat protein
VTSRHRLLQPLILVAAVGLSYANGFRGVFQFDDHNVIVNNPSVHSVAAFVANLPTGIRPLLKLTYLLNWTAGAGPFGFHVVNISLHAANTLLVFFLACRMTEGKEAPGLPAFGRVPFLAALLFAVHPVQTEAVTYISGRSMSLMAFFYLASLLSYVRGTKGGRGWLYVVSPALFLLAVLSKETALTLPAALLLWERAFGDGNRPFPEIVRRQAVHWALLLLMAAAVALHPSYRNLVLYGFGTRTASQNLLAQGYGIAYLLSRLIRVYRLNIDPDLPVPATLTPGLAATAAGLAVLLIAGAAALRRRPVAGFGLLWFFLQLLPTNSIIPRLDVANERHLYLASWGIFLAAGSGAEWVQTTLSGAGRWVRAGWFAAAALLLLFTVLRNEVYRSEVTLWAETARRSPGKARVHNNLGYAYFRSGHPERAIPEYREALRIDPDFALARGNKALAEAQILLERTAFPPR